MSTTITDLLAQVSEGESRTFEPAVKNCVEEYFFSIHTNYDYSPQIFWVNPPGFDHLPVPNFRHGPGRSIFSIEEQRLYFGGSSHNLVDYCWSNGSHFVSDKLANLIEKIDPESIERRQIWVETEDGEIPYNAVMPRRVIEGVDVRKTVINIQSELFATQWIVSIYFPNGMVFDKNLIGEAENFCQIDTHQWCWSRKLIDAAKDIGARGFCTSLPSTLGTQIDKL